MVVKPDIFERANIGIVDTHGCQQFSSGSAEQIWERNAGVLLTGPQTTVSAWFGGFPTPTTHENLSFSSHSKEMVGKWP